MCYAHVVHVYTLVNLSMSVYYSLDSSASKSRPATGSVSDVPPDKEKEKEKPAPSVKPQDNTPTTPTKIEKEKKDRPSKKKEKSSKGTPALPPVEAKPPPGPLVALGRRDKPIKRSRSVEKGTLFPSLPNPHTHSAGSVAVSHQVLYYYVSLSVFLKCICIIHQGWVTVCFMYIQTVCWKATSIISHKLLERCIISNESHYDDLYRLGGSMMLVARGACIISVGIYRT